MYDCHWLSMCIAHGGGDKYTIFFDLSDKRSSHLLTKGIYINLHLISSNLIYSNKYSKNHCKARPCAKRLESHGDLSVNTSRVRPPAPPKKTWLSCRPRRRHTSAGRYPNDHHPGTAYSIPVPWTARFCPTGCPGYPAPWGLHRDPRRILQQERLGLSLVQHPQHFEKEFPTRIVEAETLTASLDGDDWMGRGFHTKIRQRLASAQLSLMVMFFWPKTDIFQRIPACRNETVTTSRCFEHIEDIVQHMKSYGNSAKP